MRSITMNIQGSIFFSLSAMCFMVLFLVLIYLGRESLSRRCMILVWTALIAFAGCILEMVTIKVTDIGTLSPLLRELIYALNQTTMFLCSASFNMYTFQYILRDPKLKSVYKTINTVVIFTFFALMAGNLVWHFCYSFHGPEPVLTPFNYVTAYIMPAAYLALGIISILIGRTKLSNREFTALFVTHMCVLACTVIQSVINDSILLVSLGITMGLYIIYSFLETPDYMNLLATNKKLLETEQAALEASRAKSVFLSSMSHEIRTPMNAVLGMNELIRMTLKDDSLSGDQKREKILDYSGSIESSGEALLFIINDILDISKIESGKMEIVKAPYYMEQLMRDLGEQFSLQASGKGLSFNYKEDGELPGYISGDKLRVRQVITNIVSNAVKYTKEGGVSVELSGSVSGDTVCYDIKVSDTGMGIKKENIGRLFDSFSRIDNADTHFIEGTGLGLSIVKNLLELMNGSVEVESTYGEGSVFTLHIPQQILSNERLSEYEAGDPTGGGESRLCTISGKEVLVVDDNVTNIAVARNFLDRMQAEVSAATSGMAALKSIQVKKYDIIFMDHMMPGMGGDEVLREMKENRNLYSLNQDTPVVVMTANVMPGIRDKYIKEYGFTDYMTKPFRYTDLEKVIIKYVPGAEVAEGAAEAETTGQSRAKASGRLFEIPDTSVKKDAGPAGIIDRQAGIEICGSEKVYRDVIGVYTECEESNVDSLKKFYESKDWDNYAILAHGLKSSSMTIGASEFSLYSKKMEKSAMKALSGDVPSGEETADEKELGLDYIDEHFEDYVASYKKVCDALRNSGGE